MGAVRPEVVQPAAAEKSGAAAAGVGAAVPAPAAAVGVAGAVEPAPAAGPKAAVDTAQCRAQDVFRSIRSRQAKGTEQARENLVVRLSPSFI